MFTVRVYVYRYDLIGVLRPGLRPPVRRLTVPVYGPVNVPCGPDPVS
jgi:hypothetical protein